MQKPASRLPYWDNLKGILILLVVFGHMLQMLPGGNESTVYKLVYLFHMPMFVFCSGYLGSFAPKKILRTLLLPYLALQISCCLLTKQPVQLFTPYWMLWYLPALAVWRFSVPLLALCGRRGALPCLFGLLLLGCLAGYCGQIGYFLSLSRILVFWPYFAAGYYAKMHAWFRESHTFSVPIKAVFVAAALGIGTAFVFLAPQIHAEWLYGTYGYASGHYSLWFRAAQYAAVTVLGFTLLLFTPKAKTFFSAWGRESFTLYLAHIALLPVMQLVLPFFSRPLQYTMCVSVACVFCVAVSWGKPQIHALFRHLRRR